MAKITGENIMNYRESAAYDRQVVSNGLFELGIDRDLSVQGMLAPGKVEDEPLLDVAPFLSKQPFIITLKSPLLTLFQLPLVAVKYCLFCQQIFCEDNVLPSKANQFQDLRKSFGQFEHTLELLALHIFEKYQHLGFVREGIGYIIIFLVFSCFQFLKDDILNVYDSLPIHTANISYLR